MAIMKGIFVTFLFVAAAAAREHVQRMHMLPPGGERFQNDIRAERNARIVGGKEAVPHSRPFQVALIATIPDLNGPTFGGGSLLNSEWVLTAAHCIWNGKHAPASEIEVILGVHNIFDREEGSITLKSFTFFYHQHWNPRLDENDIGLVKLPTPVSTSDKIQFVNLAPRSLDDEKFVGYEATISGWGTTSDASMYIASKLQVVTTDVIAYRECNTRFLNLITPMHICTNGKEGRSTCDGDSGGAVTVEYEGKVIQVGIVSFGIKLGCERGWPAVHLRTSDYLDWISESTGLVID